jgi:hypothetical protein
MTPITIKLTTEELELLSSLASDQLFRREFIDPKMPGHKSNPGALRLGKQLAERLQGIADQAKGPQASRKNAPALKAAAGAAGGGSSSSISVEHAPLDPGKGK